MDYEMYGRVRNEGPRGSGGGSDTHSVKEGLRLEDGLSEAEPFRVVRSVVAIWELERPRRALLNVSIGEKEVQR